MMVAEADTVLSVTDTAVTVHSVRTGGHIRRCVGGRLAARSRGRRIVPHCPVQASVHCTPPLLESLLTTAVTGVLAPGAREVGGCGMKATLITGGGGGVDELLQPASPRAKRPKLRRG